LKRNRPFRTAALVATDGDEGAGTDEGDEADEADSVAPAAAPRGVSRIYAAPPVGARPRVIRGHQK
jgi:hypothetical protein